MQASSNNLPTTSESSSHRPTPPLQVPISTTAETIDTTSPVDDAGDDDTGPENQPCRPLYREAAEVPEELREQTHILFAEEIYHIGIQSLQTELFFRSYLGPDVAWWVAPPHYLAFLGTLVVHPKYTTRTKNEDDRIASVRAYQYLIHVVRSVGPVNGRFDKAFMFSSARNDRRRRAATPEDDWDGDQLAAPIANEDGLWSRVQDFWSMLGWAFACAAAHPERWTRWKLWIEFLLEVLERDVDERRALDEDRHRESNSDGEVDYKNLRHSIIMSYVKDFKLTQIMRVLFSFLDGETQADAYKEIWRNETKSPQAASSEQKWDKKVDLEHDEYGNYFDDEEEQFDEFEDQPSATGSKRTRAKSQQKKKKKLLPLVESPLLEETIPIRRRIFALLSKTCHHLDGDGAPFTLHDLYDKFAEHIKPLPLDSFPHFVWSHMPVDQAVYVTLARYMLSYLLPPGAEQPADVDPEIDARSGISEVMMERCFLPYASNSVVADNAKMAVVLYELLSHLWDRHSHVQRPLSEGMRRAILAGMEERERKSGLLKRFAAKSKMMSKFVIVGEGPPRSVLEPGWLDERMQSIEADPHAAVNVLRLAHLKFRLLLEKDKEAAPFVRSGKKLPSDFVGWK